MDTEELLTVTQELAEVARLLDADDVESTLSRYTARVVRSVPGCAAAFITTPGDGVVDTVAGTWSPAGRSLIELGPIGDALTYREPRRLADTSTDTRWPAFSAELAENGFRSAMVLPLSSIADAAATLTLLSREPDEFGESSFDLVQVFVAHAGVAFDNVRLYSDCRDLVDQLRTSLRTRSMIGQAQGLLMKAYGLDSAAAFGALREVSQRRNEKIRELARTLIEAHEAGEFERWADELGVRRR